TRRYTRERATASGESLRGLLLALRRHRFLLQRRRGSPEAESNEVVGRLGDPPELAARPFRRGRQELEQFGFDFRFLLAGGADQAEDFDFRLAFVDRGVGGGAHFRRQQAR